jgi:hypothetical protein
MSQKLGLCVSFRKIVPSVGAGIVLVVLATFRFRDCEFEYRRYHDAGETDREERVAPVDLRSDVTAEQDSQRAADRDAEGVDAECTCPLV